MGMSRLRIRGDEAFLVALPMRRSPHWAEYTTRIGDGYAVLRLDLESGIISWSEAQPIAPPGAAIMPRPMAKRRK